MTQDVSFEPFAAFAASARAADFPVEARRRALDAITDCVGCMVIGREEPLAGKLLRALPSWPAGGQGGLAVMVGSDRMATPADAALYNGALAHAIDYDDANHPAYAHPTAVLAPVILAASALGPVTGDDALAAYIVGLEMFGKLGRAFNTRHYEHGWHATSTFGTLAAAAAAARLLRLDARRMAGALSIATSFASGLRTHFGTMVKPLHAGLAARNGIQAALLAREEFSSAAAALEHQYGFAAVFNGAGNFDLQPLAQPGAPLEILTDYGISLKAFPSCGATHPGIEAATLLHGELGGAPVSRVRLGVSQFAFRPLIHHSPSTPLEGKFCLEFCVAVALTEGRVGVASFSQDRVDSPAIRSLIARTAMEVDDRVRDDPEFATAVRVETGDGRTLEKLVPLAIGKPARWFSPAQLREKFDDCCARQMTPRQADRLYAALRALPELDSLGTIEQALRVDTRVAETV